MTAVSADTINAEQFLTFDGTTLAVTGNETVSGYLSSTTYRENYSDIGSGAGTTINLSTANNFKYTFTGAGTITFSNAPAGKAFGFTLIAVNAGAWVINWTGVKWAGGTQPSLTETGTDILVFYTYDGGSTYYGFLTGKNML